MLLYQPHLKRSRKTVFNGIEMALGNCRGVGDMFRGSRWFGDMFWPAKSLEKDLQSSLINLLKTLFYMHLSPAFSSGGPGGQPIGVTAS